MSWNWNEYNLNLFPSINWRASLVSAAAGIPAPMAYVEVVRSKNSLLDFCQGQSVLRCW